MEIPLNPSGARPVAHRASVQFGLMQGKINETKAKANPERWLLRTRVLFILDRMKEDCPEIFNRNEFTRGNFLHRLGLS